MIKIVISYLELFNDDIIRLFIKDEGIEEDVNNKLSEEIPSQR